MRAYVLGLSAALASCSLFSLSGFSAGDDETRAPGDGDAGTNANDAGSDGAKGDDADTQVNLDPSETNATRYRDAVMSDTPLAYFRFEETSGATAKDETGAHDGTWLTTPMFAANGAFAGSAAV